MRKPNATTKFFIILPLGIVFSAFGMEKTEAPAPSTETPTLPIKKSYWVEPKTFLAGGYPGEISKPGRTTKAEVQENINKLLDAGITVFIDLTEAKEGKLQPYEKMLEEEAQKRDLKVDYYKMPIVDHEAPTVDEMDTILAHIDKAFADGRRIYMHCHVGKGRTPTVAACHYIRHKGLTPQEAMEKISKAYGKSVPGRPAQRKFIEEYGQKGKEATFAVISPI